MLDVLVVAPHPDDAELGMGGAIVKLRAAGRRVGVLDLTDGEPTPHGSPAIRAAETAAATAVLNLDWRENLGLANRRLEATLKLRGTSWPKSFAARGRVGCSLPTGSTRTLITWPRRS